MALTVGEKIPAILGTDENGEEIRLSDYKGKKIILYFYPKDNTSGCTAQACSLRDDYSTLRKLGYEVIGVSIDNAKSHQKFIEKNQLPFRLIADSEKLLVEKLNALSDIVSLIPQEQYQLLQLCNFNVSELQHALSLLESVPHEKPIEEQQVDAKIMSIIKVNTNDYIKATTLLTQNGVYYE